MEECGIGRARRIGIRSHVGRQAVAFALGCLGVALTVAATSAASPALAAPAETFSFASVGNKIVDALDNPTVAYVLLSLGMFGVFLEVAAPGGFLPGLTGVFLVVLGALLLNHSATIDWVGAAIMALAFLLFVADIFLPSAGLLTLGGLAAFVYGSTRLTSSDTGDNTIARPAIWIMAALFAIFFLLLGGLALKSRFGRSNVGRDGLLGTIGVVRQTLAPSGMVFAQGELWSATLDESTGHHELEQGKSVVVIGLDGLRLIVRPATDTEQRSGASVAVPPWGRPEPV